MSTHSRQLSRGFTFLYSAPLSAGGRSQFSPIRDMLGVVSELALVAQNLCNMKIICAGSILTASLPLMHNWPPLRFDSGTTPMNPDLWQTCRFGPARREKAYNDGGFRCSQMRVK